MGFELTISGPGKARPFWKWSKPLRTRRELKSRLLLRSDVLETSLFFTAIQAEPGRSLVGKRKRQCETCVLICGFFSKKTQMGTLVPISIQIGALSLSVFIWKISISAHSAILHWLGLLTRAIQLVKSYSLS